MKWLPWFLLATCAFLGCDNAPLQPRQYAPCEWPRLAPGDDVVAYECTNRHGIAMCALTRQGYVMHTDAQCVQGGYVCVSECP